MDYQSFYQWSIDDPESFWAEQATAIDWQALPERLLDYANPSFGK